MSMYVPVPNTTQQSFNFLHLYQELLTLFRTAFLNSSNQMIALHTKNILILEVINDEIENLLVLSSS